MNWDFRPRKAKTENPLQALLTRHSATGSPESGSAMRKPVSTSRAHVL